VIKVPDKLREVLDATGHPWTITSGGKHFKIKLAGRLVAVLPHGKTSDSYKRSLLNTITQVRKMARELDGEKV
jgi:hypothetical protein